jgi:hypothetical protein
MSEENGSGGKKQFNDGYVPLKKGYKPDSGMVGAGHKPEKSEAKPTNPPKKK